MIAWAKVVNDNRDRKGRQILKIGVTGLSDELDLEG